METDSAPEAALEPRRPAYAVRVAAETFGTGAPIRINR